MEDEPVPPKPIFQKRKFVVTSSARIIRPSQIPFNKREFRTLIEQRGGTIIEDFKDLRPDDEVFLVSDTHYRTHKYLSALSLSVPCVHHTWITECVKKDAFVDFKKYMLPAGQADGPDGTAHECEWKPHKGQLLAGKTVWIHSNIVPEPPVIEFFKLWSPIVSAAGAKVVSDKEVPSNQLRLMRWLSRDGVDVILTDRSCEVWIVEAIEASDRGVVVGDDWVIEALITGKLPDATNRYGHNNDAAAQASSSTLSGFSVL